MLYKQTLRQKKLIRRNIHPPTLSPSTTQANQKQEKAKIHGQVMEPKAETLRKGERGREREREKEGERERERERKRDRQTDRDRARARGDPTHLDPFVVPPVCSTESGQPSPPSP